MDIAVLGMGRMGSALAMRLLDGGHQVTVWNRSKGKAAEVVSAGAREARSVADAVRDADVVITMLANDDAVRAVALGDLRSSLGDQAVYVNTSTVSPALNSELARAFPGRFLAVPVLGSPDAVRAGQAGYLTGGDGRVADLLAPVLSSLSATIHRYDTPAWPPPPSSHPTCSCCHRSPPWPSHSPSAGPGGCRTTSCANCSAAAPWWRPASRTASRPS